MPQDIKVTDPYNNLPVLTGSILAGNVTCTKMIMAKHQAALIWAHKEG
jgi:hypothetical protein